mgnify:CR=1 FL=1
MQRDYELLKSVLSVPSKTYQEEQMVEFIGADRQVMVARELSKMHEQMVRGTTSEVLAFFNAHPDKVRGEIVIVIAGK